MLKLSSQTETAMDTNLEDYNTSDIQLFFALIFSSIREKINLVNDDLISLQTIKSIKLQCY